MREFACYISNNPQFAIYIQFYSEIPSFKLLGDIFAQNLSSMTCIWSMNCLRFDMLLAAIFSVFGKR